MCDCLGPVSMRSQTWSIRWWPRNSSSLSSCGPGVIPVLLALLRSQAQRHTPSSPSLPLCDVHRTPSALLVCELTTQALAGYSAGTAGPQGSVRHQRGRRPTGDTGWSAPCLTQPAVACMVVAPSLLLPGHRVRAFGCFGVDTAGAAAGCQHDGAHIRVGCCCLWIHMCARHTRIIRCLVGSFWTWISCMTCILCMPCMTNDMHRAAPSRWGRPTRARSSLPSGACACCAHYRRIRPSAMPWRRTASVW